MSSAMSNAPLPSSFDGDTEFYQENTLQKIGRRIKEDPLVPFGCLLTCAALVGATRSIRAGDHNRTQRMFRARIYAQAFTLAAVVAGSMYWKTDRQKRKEFDAVVLEKLAQEKRAAWIKELEVRDQEDKEEQERMKRRLERLKSGGKNESGSSILSQVKRSEKKVEKIQDNVKEQNVGSVVEGADANGKGVWESTVGWVWGSKK